MTKTVYNTSKIHVKYKKNVNQTLDLFKPMCFTTSTRITVKQFRPGKPIKNLSSFLQKYLTNPEGSAMPKFGFHRPIGATGSLG